MRSAKHDLIQSLRDERVGVGGRLEISRSLLNTVPLFIRLISK